ncbi:uncharacterized protein FTOL_01306 [Fusarium torulosum]|uniref:Uncharacterized protein n=1 Tax=Fusarium torulosum TaxID=33205 RepID=A0AAE8SDA3_9HYPO|nr:uncharacterized protein FTOL_01306 [Fusarium torulosum]
MLDSVEGLAVALLGGFSGLRGSSTQEQSGELRDRLVLEFWRYYPKSSPGQGEYTWGNSVLESASNSSAAPSNQACQAKPNKVQRQPTSIFRVNHTPKNDLTLWGPLGFAVPGARTARRTAGLVQNAGKLAWVQIDSFGCGAMR